ncbi:MAG: 1-acyl-sn-glycerol-3-phosphate acyltransferase [Deltaproteobacteria bacterium]|nr:1-acyl-sn-glycerol-3-phosphate acyltransferase [Deltaproteobacteria bacterium]
MFRFIFLNLFIALHTLMFGIYGILLALFGGSAGFVHFFCAVPWAKTVLKVCGVKVEIKGYQPALGKLPRIYMANHCSYFDIFALLSALPVDFKFIVKQELMEIPVFGHAMKRAGYIGIERQDPRKAMKSMQKAAERIRKGASVLIFPEGTRSDEGKLQPFKPGGFHLALKSGCDIVPITITGSHRIAPKGSWSIRRGAIHINVGEAIPLKGRSRKNMREVMDEVKKAMSVSDRILPC